MIDTLYGSLWRSEQKIWANEHNNRNSKNTLSLQFAFLGQRAQFKQHIGVGSIFVTHFLYHNANLCEKNWVFVIFLQYQPLCYLNVEFLLISF